MSDVTNKPALRVVRGKEDALLRKEHRDGYVYFATDTGKIYMDTASEEKILMGGGGNSGIYYAQKKFTAATDTTFSIDDIITKELPSENDLIINTSAEIGGDIERDGFYQVLQVVELENKVIAKQLPVGGGGGGIGPGGTMGFASIDYIVPKDGVASTLISEDYWIEYKLTAEDSAGDTVPYSGTATWIINGKTIDGGQIYPGTNKFNVTKYLDSRLDVNNVKLSVAIMTGSASPTIVSKTWQITAIDLKLEWDYTYSADSYVNKDTFTVSFTPWGNVACKAYLLFDNNEDYRYSMDIPASKTGKTNYFTLDSLPYGTHRGQMWLTATINGKDYRTSTITHELTFVYGGNAPIITTPFSQVSATQYDTIRIPFLIYNPETTETAMRVLVNDVEVSTLKNYNRDLHNFDYTIGLSGTVKIKLEHDTNNYREFELSVTPLELDVEEPQTPTYKLKADTIVDNAALQALPGLTFSENFDWQNGGMQSETSEDGVITKYICIKNGTTMTIDYNLFGNDATQYGKNFKFIFKATKCYDYDARVLECFDSTKGVGINVTAQRATFNSGSIELKADYCENSYIELEMEVWPKHNIDQYMMMWIDGVPSNVRIYESDTFQQSNGNIKPITIGSNDCDVYVYLVKIYERMLNEEEHLENFIMDAPNTQEKIARYKRNDILDNSGEISYKKLVKNNPNCHAYLYEIPYMTIDKNTKVPCQYTEYCNDSETPIITANDALMFVQGTSSAAYGIAAFNLRTDFRDTTMYNGKGEEIAGKEVSETAIPIDYACTKVNVASCENANNVVNAEWYNKFQPYHDAHRRKVRADGKKYRDCMEFDFGVVFVKDKNQETSYRGSDGKPSEGAYLAANVFADTPNYTKSPYYKQYAVGNMGNDKKNVEVFHDTENPLACCVEVANNQTAKQFMTEKITVADLGDKVTENYEFRYPDGNKKASTVMKEGWVRFVNWMADSNPAAADSTKILQAVPVDFSKEPFVKNKFYVLNNEGKYIKSFEDYNEGTTYYNIIAKKPTGSEQLIEVLFDSYTFKGFDPPGYEGQKNPTGISIKGTTISDYSTTKITKVPKRDEEGNIKYDDNGFIILENQYSVEPYQYDTYDYRMAKMISECEDYLVMDSVIFHYLFIQRHTMIDNVAKNTFWSSEDCIHWDLTKNYDNDTSDGNDNSGYLVYNYGIEILDENNIFNAPASVWLNFIHGLDEAQQALYQALEKKGAWKSEPYLQAFKDGQNCIPERCWIQDYFRKYIRPRRLGLDTDSFLKRLEGGKKTHQREQYETYQEYYLNSKYMAGSLFTESTSLDLRLNALEGVAWDKTLTIPITAYIDLYPSALIGTTGLSNSWRGERLSRGDKAYIPVGEILDSPKDGTCYIFGADMIQTVEKLYDVYPSYATLSRAKRLRTLELGSDKEGYYNPKLRAADISGNSMLETALIQNSGNPESNLGALNLNKYDETYGYEPLKALKTLKLDGSNYTELTLAENGLLETLALNDLKSLSMSNLTKLRNVTYDPNIVNTLKTLYVDNCTGINTQYLVENCNLLDYYLLGINWTITTNSLVDGELKRIDILDKLLAANPKEEQKASLSGTIKIDLPTNFTVDEYDIYNIYQKEYPNVTITYGTKATIMSNDIPGRAPKIVFKKDDTENSEVLYWVLTDGSGTQDLRGLTSAEGPAGEAIKEPSKSSTNMYTYHWNANEDDRDNWIFEGYKENEWKYQLSNGDWVELTHEGMLDLKPEGDMTLVPIFSTAYRKYTVHVKDYDQTYLPGYPKVVTYGQDLANEIPKYMERTHSEENKRWSFKGWISAADFLSSNQNPEFVTDFRITSDLTVYAFYKEEKVNEVATEYKYFNITNGTITLNPTYKNSLSGKVTLPSVDEESGNYITTIGEGAFRDATQITAIYFLDDAKYTTVGKSAFRTCPLLTKVMLPNTITSIDEYAFAQSREVVDIGILNENNTTLRSIGNNAFSGGTSSMKITVNELPANLEELGNNAFQNGGPNVKITKLPINIEVLKQFCFTYCPKVQITYFGSDGTGSKLQEIQQQCFYGAGNGLLITTDTRIYFDKTVMTFGENCFSGANGEGYMYNNIKNVSFSHPKTDYVVPAGKPDFINYTGIQTDGRTVTFNDNDNT